MEQTKCNYFGTPSGCNRGSACKFLHQTVKIIPPKQKGGIPEKFRCKRIDRTDCRDVNCPFWHRGDPEIWCNTTSYCATKCSSESWMSDAAHDRECFHFRPMTPCRHGASCPNKETSCFFQHPPKPAPTPANRVIIERPVRRECPGYRYMCGDDALPGDPDDLCKNCRDNVQSDDWSMAEFEHQ